MSTKVIDASKKDGKVYVNVEAAKGGDKETVRILFISIIIYSVKKYVNFLC